MKPAEDKSSQGSGAAALFAILLIVLPVLYVLSIGPVARLVPSPPDWLEAIYFPILWPAEHFEPFREMLEWYLELWGAH